MEQKSSESQGCPTVSVLTLHSFYTSFLSSHSMPRPWGRHRGDADLPPGSSPASFQSLGCSSLCFVSKVHLPLPLFDALKGENAFSLCFDTTVTGRNQSSVRLNQASNLIYIDKYMTFGGPEGS